MGVDRSCASNSGSYMSPAGDVIPPGRRGHRRRGLPSIAQFNFHTVEQRHLSARKTFFCSRLISAPMPLRIIISGIILVGVNKLVILLYPKSVAQPRQPFRLCVFAVLRVKSYPFQDQCGTRKR